MTTRTSGGSENMSRMDMSLWMDNCEEDNWLPGRFPAKNFHGNDVHVQREVCGVPQ